MGVHDKARRCESMPVGLAVGDIENAIADAAFEVVMVPQVGLFVSRRFTRQVNLADASVEQQHLDVAVNRSETECGRFIARQRVQFGRRQGSSCALNRPEYRRALPGVAFHCQGYSSLSTA